MAALAAASLTDNNIGELEAGWSVTEAVTPHDISGQPAATGSASFAGQSFAESSFAIDRTSTLASDMGSVTGAVDSVGVDNLRAQISQGSILTKLNVDLPSTSPAMGGTWSLSAHFSRAIKAILPAAVVNYTASVDPQVVTPLWRGNVWDMLNQLASAYKREIATSGSTIIVRDVGSTILPLEDFDNSSKSKLSINTQASGQVVEISYYQSAAVTNQEVYNAFTSNNQVFQADYGETTEVTIPTDTYFTTLVQPTPMNVPKPFKAPITTVGAYCITASDNLPVPAALWTRYGGSVRVRIGDDPNSLVVSVTGPRWRIPGYDGPYRLTVSDGQNDYATLSVRGTGVKTNPQTLALSTGADPAIATQETATRVDNIFISTLAQAYDRGVWASASAAGPTVTLTCSVPTDQLPGFGLTCGSLIRYRNSIYRIMQATIGALRTSLSAVQYVTAGDEASAWSGKSAGEYAAFWAGKTAGQASVEPLRTS